MRLDDEREKLSQARKLIRDVYWTNRPGWKMQENILDVIESLITKIESCPCLTLID